MTPRATMIAATPRQTADVGAGLAFDPAGAHHGQGLAMPASALAARFLVWLREHGLSRREWTVDDLWFLVAEDFAPALDFEVPKRRVFLGALQKLAGVQVQYDRRLYDRRGQLLRKTTFYRFAPATEAEPKKVAADLPLFALAA
jgi:hypothetical protein